MRIDLTGKVAIVTGASGGIGKACAKYLLENGAKVVVADIKDEAGERTVKELSFFGPCLYIHVDITEHKQVDQLVEMVLSKFTTIDILVNNAGINVGGDPADRTDIDKFTEENWHRLLAVNLTGTFYCSQAVARVMIRQKSGRIINIGSVLGSVPARKQIAFIAAKGGVHNMTKAMALELAPYNINVNGVAPGSIAMDINMFCGKDAAQAERQERMLSHVPLHCFGDVGDIANAVLFFSGQESKYITGHILTVDGGWTCGYTRDF
jgi:3-oxoacyl-[acyl-carrier protein] reductase